MPEAPILWQFRFSHFNEKARWALDYKRVPHIRKSVLPGAHVPIIRRLTGQQLVPVLRLDGRMIADSTAIIAALEEAYPEPPLYPAGEAARKRALDLEDYFDEELGAPLRLAWFQEQFKDPGYLARQFSVGTGPLERTMFRVVFPLVSKVIRTRMGINAANAALARDRVMAVLDRLEAEIQPSGYLVGDAFSVADLTAAALWSPFVMPPEFPYPFIDGAPPSALAWRESLIRRPGLLWVAEIYRRHRGKSSAVAD